MTLAQTRCQQEEGSRELSPLEFKGKDIFFFFFNQSFPTNLIEAKALPPVLQKLEIFQKTWLQGAVHQGLITNQIKCL